MTAAAYAEPHGPAADVRLRRYTDDDVDASFLMCLDPEVQRWTTVPVPYRREDAEQFVHGRVREGWADGSDYTLVVDAEDDEGRRRFAGNLSLRPDGADGAEIGFALAPWARGRGVMSRAVRLALAWAFLPDANGGLGLDVVRWSAHVGNWGSRRVAWACGFRVEGTLRGLNRQRGRSVDGWAASICRGEPTTPVTPWLEAVTLHGDGAHLRPWRETDVVRVAEACSDEDSRRWLPQLPVPYTLADAQWYLRTREEQHAGGEGVYWCVADDEDQALGAVSVMRLDASLTNAEIGYWAHPDARGRGVMTCAVRLVARHVLLPPDVGGLGAPRVQPARGGRQRRQQRGGGAGRVPARGPAARGRACCATAPAPTSWSGTCCRTVTPAP
ncbi:hypothetical protein GCM10025868_37080 [Angustibacter aerolatus]|uniref:N-acetyltransferase domain-containing protein n=1 Tax=Angustibacter aerolatus TaxID=1162965 RepID=A0ABQ6JM45_9ACTN|nr:GNAT family N-acetyltransferase [Angustibacter aerolatus]GMA88458.1 hypothetical protein GCM10025868_37080 [Angustibacter aerolatus]